jgi:hypothetical protein
LISPERRHWILLAISLLAFALRFPASFWGDPYSYHFDEPFIAKPAAHIAATGDMNPHFFRYPSGLIYAEAGVIALNRSNAAMNLSPAEGAGYGPADLSAGWWPAILGGRHVVVVAGAAGVYAVGLLAWRLAGPLAGVLAALLLAFFPLHVEHSAYLTTDVPAATLLLAAFAAAVRSRPNLRDFAVAGAWLGAAAATKYTAAIGAGGLIALALLGDAPRRWGGIAVAAAATIAVFLLLCPYSLLDWSGFVADLRIVRDHYRGGHLGAEGTANWLWYLTRLRQDGLGVPGMVLMATGCAGVLAWPMLARGEREDSARRPLLAGVVLATAVLWFLWLGSVRVRFERNMMFAATLATAAAGCGLAALIRAVGRLGRPAGVVASLLFAAAMAGPLALSVVHVSRFAGGDTRSLARAWIEANVEPGASIVREEFTPRPDPDRYRVEYVWSLASRPVGWYAVNDVDYVVASAAVYNRYMNAHGPGMDAARATYRRIAMLPRAAVFAPGFGLGGPAGPLITIHRVPRNDGTGSSRP